MTAQRGEPFHEHMDYAANEITFTTLFADNKTIYMSAGFYDERIICDENEKLIGSLEKLKELIEKRKAQC